MGHNPTIGNIVRHFLEANGYDGLYHPARCACKKDDLMPCGEVGAFCKAGYFRQPSEEDDLGADFYIGPAREAG